MKVIDATSLENELKRRYEKLESDKESLRLSWLLKRGCRCRSNDCKHYKEEYKKMFERRIDELLSFGIMLSIAEDVQAIRFRTLKV